MDGDAAGFKVKLIDTIGLEDQESGDSVNYAVSGHGIPRREPSS
jgi:hypothetical protein